MASAWEEVALDKKRHGSGEHKKRESVSHIGEISCRKISTREPRYSVQQGEMD
jgi:hypothetical protein